MSIQAPFTPKQVEALRTHQDAGFVHPYTCIYHSDVAMTVETEGLKCPTCGHVQEWAIEVDKKAIDQLNEVVEAMKKKAGLIK